MSKESKQRFTSAMSEIKGKLSAEALEEVNGLLSSLNREFLDVEGDVSALYKESMTRKEDLTSLKSEIENLKTENQSLKDSGLNEKLEEITKERDSYKTEIDTWKETEAKANRDKFLSKYDSIKDHVDFEKAKNFFKLPEVKDEKMDWDSLENDAFKSNLSELEKMETLGHFQVGGSSPDANSKRSGQPKKSPADDYPSN